jgi:hypothetical protein
MLKGCEQQAQGISASAQRASPRSKTGAGGGTFGEKKGGNLHEVSLSSNIVSIQTKLLASFNIPY